MTRIWLYSLACLLFATRAFAEHRVAVVIGNNYGDPGEQPLEYAEDDARRFHQLLTTAGGVDDARAYLLTGPDATAEVVRAKLAEAAGRILELKATGATALIVYVSAHADAEQLHLDGTRLPIVELRRAVADAGARFRLVVLDACRTAVVARLRGGRPTRDVALASELKSRVEGNVMISSASYGEPAQEWGHLRGSLFTHHLLAGLRGLADLDANGQISLAEAYAHAFRRTTAASARSSAGAQHPSFDMEMAGWGEWIFSQPEKFGARLVLSEELEGTILITDLRHELVAEVEKLRGEAQRVAVRPGWYRVLRPQGRFTDVADVNLAFGGERRIEKDVFVRTPATNVSLRGSEPIALKPWRIGLGYRGARGMVEGVRVGHFAQASVGRDLRSFNLRLRGAGSYQQFRGQMLQVQQRQGELALGVARRWWLGFTTLDLGLEAGAALIRQRTVRDDAARIERVLGAEEPVRTAVVPLAGAFGVASLPITETFWLTLEVALTFARVPLADGRSLELVPAFGLALAYGF